MNGVKPKRMFGNLCSEIDRTEMFDFAQTCLLTCHHHSLGLSERSKPLHVREKLYLDRMMTKINDLVCVCCGCADKHLDCFCTAHTHI